MRTVVKTAATRKELLRTSSVSDGDLTALTNRTCAILYTSELIDTGGPEGWGAAGSWPLFSTAIAPLEVVIGSPLNRISFPVIKLRRW